MFLEKIQSANVIKSEFYIKRYIKFINAFGGVRYGNNTEYHHILPKAYFKQYEYSSWNIIELDVRVHYVAHMLLAKAVGGKMIQAFQLMGRFKKHTSTMFAMFKKYAKPLSPEVNAQISKSVTKLWEDPEYRKRQSEAHKGYVQSQEARDKVSKANRGKKKPEGFRVGARASEETREKLSKAKMGIRPGTKVPLTLYNADGVPVLTIIGAVESTLRELGLPSSLLSAYRNGGKVYDNLRGCDISKLMNLGLYQKYADWYLQKAI